MWNIQYTLRIEYRPVDGLTTVQKLSLRGQDRRKQLIRGLLHLVYLLMSEPEMRVKDFPVVCG